MQNAKFIQIHVANNFEYIKEIFDMVSKPLSSHNASFVRCSILNKSNFTTLIRLIQAEKAGVNGCDAWSFPFDLSREAIYNSLSPYITK